MSEARHLGVLLDAAAAAPPPSEQEIQEVADALAAWRAEALREELRLPDEAIQPAPESLTDFQQDYLAAREEVLSSLTPEERAQLAEAFAAEPQQLTRPS